MAVLPFHAELSRCRWHLDEVFVSIHGKKMKLWRTVDSEGEGLDILA
ncbi:MAG: DDE-type integrase/transposase/recombinase [Rhodospirillales bacterium]|nr:DDE-type integrase/transposase/recombinase [Rhodospirillales bacterium]